MSDHRTGVVADHHKSVFVWRVLDLEAGVMAWPLHAEARCPTALPIVRLLLGQAT